MKIVFGLIFCSFSLLQNVESKKLKICLPRKKVNDQDHNEEVVISFNKTLEELSEGSDEIHIPGTFPMEINVAKLMSGKISVSDLTISGFKDIEYKKIPNTPIPKSIIFKEIKVQGKNYSISGSVYDLFVLYGNNGTFSVSLQDLTISIDDIFPTLPIGCFKLDIGVKLQTLKANFKNLMGGDPALEYLMNRVIGDLGPDIVEFYWPIIYDTAQPWLQKIIDKYINKMELENFLTILTRHGTSEFNG